MKTLRIPKKAFEQFAHRLASLDFIWWSEGSEREMEGFRFCYPEKRLEVIADLWWAIHNPKIETIIRGYLSYGDVMILDVEFPEGAVNFKIRTEKL